MQGESSFKLVTGLFVVLMAIVLYRVFHPSTTFAADGMDPGWDAAVERSRLEAKPIVVLFTAEWCPTCRALHSDVLSRSDVRQELSSHYSFYKVDLTDPTPRVRAHAGKLGVSGIPLMIRYNADGKETDRVNYLSPAQMITWLKAGE